MSFFFFFKYITSLHTDSQCLVLVLKVLGEELGHVYNLFCHVTAGDLFNYDPVFIQITVPSRLSWPRPLLLFPLCLNKLEIGLSLHV